MPSIRRLLSAASWPPPCQAALLAATLLAASPSARAGEGGTSHVLPGANATLMDAVPSAPGAFFKPISLHYQGDASVPIPTAAGIASRLDATANTVVLGGGWTFEPTVLGGAHYTVGAFLPYSWLKISADLQGSAGRVSHRSQVSGAGDLTLVPAMLAWKMGHWQFDALLPIYAPIGSYQQGRLGNPGLNYWTFDPMVGLTYSNPSSGFNALLHLGYGINTENTATAYKSGAILHLDGALQQIVPLESGFLTVGAEGFYFDQITPDSGAGASLGAFKGRTAGLGPVLGWIQPIGKQSLALELKWLAELDTRRRLKGDYLWLKAAYKF